MTRLLLRSAGRTWDIREVPGEDEKWVGKVLPDDQMPPLALAFEGAFASAVVEKIAQHVLRDHPKGGAEQFLMRNELMLEIDDEEAAPYRFRFQVWWDSDEREWVALSLSAGKFKGLFLTPLVDKIRANLKVAA